MVFNCLALQEFSKKQKERQIILLVFPLSEINLLASSGSGGSEPRGDRRIKDSI